MSYVISAIADLHFGAPEPEHLIETLEKYYLKKLKKLPKLDAIIIDGDLYDNIFNLQNKSVKYSFLFMSKLMKIAKNKKAKVRLIQGTLFHDGKHQLDNFKFYEYDTEYDFRIIKTVEEELLFENFPVLYLPEEYVKDKDKYYKKYLNNKNYYKMIFGHGMFTEVAFGKQNEIIKQEAPIFDVSDIGSICTGPIVFGHIHARTNLYNKVYYCGSFERWKHGEELSKGSLLILMNPNNDKYVVCVLENKDARKYITIKYIEDIIDKYNEDEIIKYVTDIYAKEKIYKLKIVIDCTKIKDDVKAEVLKTYFNKIKMIDVELLNSDIKKDLDNTDDEELIKEYEYIFKENLSMEDKLTKFIEQKFNYILEPAQISQLLLNDNISDIMKEINSDI